MLTETLLGSIEVPGEREATIHLTDTAVAHGFAAAIADRLDVTAAYGRGERVSPARAQIIVRRSLTPAGDRTSRTTRPSIPAKSDGFAV